MIYFSKMMILAETIYQTYNIGLLAIVKTF